MRVGFLHSLIRKEEKLLLEELKRHPGAEVLMLDDRRLIFDLQRAPEVDVVLERCINHSRAMHGLRLFESAGIRCVNTADVASVCGNKILTSLALKDHGVFALPAGPTVIRLLPPLVITDAQLDTVAETLIAVLTDD